MTNPKNGSTLASWQLISIGAGSVVILGLVGFGAWNLFSPRSNTSQSNPASQAQDAPQKTSDTGVLPEGVKISEVTPPERKDTQSESQNNIGAVPEGQGRPSESQNNIGAVPAGEGRPSEAQNIIAALNRAHQASYMEKGEFTSNWADLGMGIPTETENYKYTIDVIDREQMVQVIATSKQKGLKSYLGIVYLVEINNEQATKSVRCESLQPTTAIPPRPSNSGRNTGELVCPDGYKNLESR